MITPINNRHPRLHKRNMCISIINKSVKRNAINTINMVYSFAIVKVCFNSTVFACSIALSYNGPSVWTSWTSKIVNNKIIIEERCFILCVSEKTHYVCIIQNFEVYKLIFSNVETDFAQTCLYQTIVRCSTEWEAKPDLGKKKHIICN